MLVDFWTYSCINCLRTMPDLKAWAEKYRDQGLVVIGVHAPESVVSAEDAKGVQQAADIGQVASPETCLGYERAQNFASPASVCISWCGSRAASPTAPSASNSSIPAHKPTPLSLVETESTS